MTLRYESQSVLFAKTLSRLDLIELSLPEESRRVVAVNVWRNHAFESLIPLMEPFCVFGKWRAEFHLGSYDDSLMFDDWKPADLELVWLDSSRFSLDTNFDGWLDWLRGRVGRLRNISSAAIVLATWTLNKGQSRKLQEIVGQIPDVYFADLKEACEDASIPFLEPRTAKLAGSPVGKSAQLVVARKLACHWLPAILFPPIKAIAVDLDDTLHSGVLGEDGIGGVRLTDGHRELQRLLKSLRKRGIFIALISRNEHPDVEALFAERQDFPLRWSDFSAAEVSWGDKVLAMERVVKVLRVAPDSVLFVDDNPGELASMCLRLPEIHTAYAHPDASLTNRVIAFYPGLWRWKVESDAGKRIQDLHANAERTAIEKQGIEGAEYFRNLGVTLTYRQNPREQITRLADLCNRTNQFNLAMRRFRQIELSERMNSDDFAVASVGLSDRLAESGVIAVIVAERVDDRMIVEELCISCRAIGRRLEDTIILMALRTMPIFPGCTEVAFWGSHGPRNQPALTWLAQLLKLNELPEPGMYSLPADRLLAFEAEAGITLDDGVHSCL